MIIFEILGKIFVQLLFEGLILGFFKLIGKGFNKLGKLFSGTETPIDPIKVLEKKYLYKKIELTENLSEDLISGRQGAVMEIIDKDNVFAEFYDSKGKQIALNNELVFKIGMNQFKLKK
ncbi:hypothetical protein [uncultured Psychroserpens sp.]|uniref:hypothetical protein n=1 Tax=uncultured Psychroserpens sp. TaxID=255436 RepID=UPI002615A79F|nr:hypothetical protein [uncultured Psychroserpens sp.]